MMAKKMALQQKKTQLHMKNLGKKLAKKEDLALRRLQATKKKAFDLQKSKKDQEIHQKECQEKQKAVKNAMMMKATKFAQCDSELLDDNSLY